MEHYADGLRPIERSLVIPVYCNEENIPHLTNALEGLVGRSSKVMEVIFVVDGSPDNAEKLLLDAQQRVSFPSKVIGHSRNFGSFTAIRTGLQYVSSDIISVMAADLQEPPELILQFFEKLENDEADLVFGTRIRRQDGWLNNQLSRVFWAFYRRMVMQDVPKGGVDVFGCNRRVCDAVLSIEEPNSSLVAQLFWVGFRRSFVPYERRKRTHGSSAWNFSRRVRYLTDSIFSYSDFPILMVIWAGALGCLLSLAYGIAIIIGRLLNYINEPGFAALGALITFSMSLLLLVQGILGSYLWRTFENTKRRPMNIVSGVSVAAGRLDVTMGTDRST